MTLPISILMPFSQIKHLRATTKTIDIISHCPRRWQRSGFSTTSFRPEGDAKSETPLLFVSGFSRYDDRLLILKHYRPEMPTLLQLGKQDSIKYGHAIP